MKNKCADTVADILVENIILRFGMPLVIHSDQGREFENGLMKFSFSLSGSGRCTSLEALECSGVSQAVVSTTSDWIILYTSKANWTYDIINTEISKKL